MGKHWSWNPRRKRRHDLRRGTRRTLCGRPADKVVLARQGLRYPKDRSNCMKCGDALYAGLARSFGRTYRKMRRGQLVSIPTDAEFLESGYREKPKGRRR